MPGNDKFVSYLLGGEMMCVRSQLKKKKKKCIVLGKKIDVSVFTALLQLIVVGGSVEKIEKKQAWCWLPPPATAIYLLYYGGVERQYYMLRTKNGRLIFAHLYETGIREISAMGLPPDVWWEFRKEIEKAPLGIPSSM